jgi:purine-nucleoside/S-methyl-5'-thioadenosine phosphorylase / adenosine deaminase
MEQSSRMPDCKPTSSGSVPASITSPLLAQAGFVNAFFTRAGGVSQPPWDTLSFAAGTGDDPTAVRENLERAARILGVPSARLYFLSQVHGVAVQVLTGDVDRDVVLRAVGDITLSRVPGVACGVRTADCVPILIADRTSGAVAAIHSGWKGTVANAAAAGVRALRALVGGEGDLLAAIGPHIEACCFEVGPDVAAELAGCSSLGASAVIAGDKPHVSLRAIVRAQLEAEGIGADAIDDVRGCTVGDRERFHSYRRDGKIGGRLLSAIVVRGPSGAMRE